MNIQVKVIYYGDNDGIIPLKYSGWRYFKENVINMDNVCQLFDWATFPTGLGFDY